MNDLEDINPFLKKIYNFIDNSNFVVFCYNEQPKASIKSIVSIYNFFIKRVLPKIPYLNSLTNKFWNKKNKFLSKAEAWGRLVYSGFDIISEKFFNDRSYITCKKESIPEHSSNPSFYPIIKLRRVGYGGKIIHSYKIRSMFPYSEFVQKKIFEINNLSKTGKIENDFRITEYGKFIRKFWIDELPQIINLLKCEIKLVGIRAMSEHYFSIYPEDYQELYKKVKPGFLSPLYDNTNFDCIVQTEKLYLEQYIQNPWRTDIKYFFIIVYDILSGKRSS
ncbi:MAG: sugar transferase [Candidatus Methanofastidiosa archaeon]|nr:sugar transferase [Candidatus Methanofastidiosa archaeon]